MLRGREGERKQTIRAERKFLGCIGYRCFFHPESSCTRKDWTAKEEVRLDQLVMEHSARVITTDVVQCRLMITDDNVNYTSKHITSEAWNRFLPTEYKEVRSETRR